MGLRTERGGDNLPGSLLAWAESLVGRLDPSQYSNLYRLASNARQQIMGSAREWQPFESLLLESGIDRGDRNHVTAIMLALMPHVLKREKFARLAAVKSTRERTKKIGVPVQQRRTGKFAVSTESSSSIDKGARRFPLALDRLAKK